MANKGFFVFDALVYAFRMCLTQARLILISAIVFAVGFMVTGFLINAITNGDFFDLLGLLRSCNTDECTLVMRAIMNYCTNNYLKMLATWSLLILFISWFWLGVVRISLELYDDEESSAGLFFSNLYQLPKAFVAVNIFIVVACIGFCALIIPGLVWTIRAGYFMWFIVDDNVGILESFKKSNAAVEGYSWYIYGVMQALMFVPGFVNTLIGLLSNAYIYRYLTKR